MQLGKRLQALEVCVDIKASELVGPQSAATRQQSTAHSNLHAFELHGTYALYRIKSRTVQDLIQKFESQNIGFLAQIGSLIEECLPVPHYY